MGKSSKNKNNKVPTSPTAGPASSPDPGSCAGAATFLDDLTEEDRKNALNWGCTSLELFQAQKTKMAALEKKAQEDQKAQMRQNEKKQQWDKDQQKESRKQDKQSQKSDKELERCVQKALLQGVVETEWGDDAEGGSFWAHIDGKDWRKVSGEYYCTLCTAELNYCTLQSHLDGQKHVKNVRNYMPGAASAAASSGVAPPPKAPPKAAPKAPPASAASWAGYSPVAQVEEWMEVVGDGSYKCIPCGKVITEEHLCKPDHLNRLENWHFQKDMTLTGYPAPKEVHLAWVPSCDEPGAQKWQKCLLCNKFCQDEWSHLSQPGEPNPTGSKEHLKNLRNYEWYEKTVVEEKLKYHPELARAAAAPSRSKAPPAAKAAPTNIAPWGKAASAAAAPAAASAAPTAWAKPAPAAKAPPATAAAPALPEGWTEHAEGDTLFYHHEATATTQWEFPTGVPAAAAAAAAPSALPDGWTTEVDEAGNTYYFHAETNKTQWDPPGDVTLPDVTLPEGWQQGLSDGSVYYYKEATGEASWDIPPS